MLKMGAPHCIVCNVPAIAHGHLLNSKNLGAYKPVLCNSAPRKHQCYFLRGGFEGGHAVKTVEVAVRSVRTETETGESVAFKEEGFAVKVLKGSPLPFGATARDGGVNFAVHSSRATSVTICFFTLSDLHKGKVTKKIPLDPLLNKTGDVWHTFLAGKFDGTLYGYQVDGEYCPEEGHRYDQSCILLDPYARAIISREQYGVLGPGGNCWPQMAGMVPVPDDEFDWQGDLPLKLPQKDLFIYEMHVRGFTRHGSSNVNHPGTYLGLVEKLEHLKELGVNAIELMPCQEFNELEYYSYNSVMGDYKMNFWGYSTINYFSPMIRYAASGVRNCGHDAIKEFKTFVREAHKHGIEVFMDVVFNHTAEGNDMGPTLSFRGLDNSMYYMLAPQGEFYNYSGCGNTFNCNHPIVRRFIVDCLRCPRTDDPWLTLLYPYFAMENSEHGLDNLEERKGLSRENKYWVIEMHIDGFRFDLASIMTRASSLWNGENVFGNDIEGDFLTTGTPLNEPPLIDMISNDPVLRGVKLIAEAWDTGGLYQVGNFPHWGIWSEWNGQYRDVTRQFIKGTDGLAGAFAQCLCGSPHLYQKGGRRPWHSVNFVCAHDGFSLADLVSYNQKHNLANGEDNNDGDDHNNSWNCGEEGELVGLPVQRLRQRQMRNFIVCLMVSQGVPMLTMGDEYGHTKGGNNNTYCHDNNVNYFRWDKKVTSQAEFFKFCCLMAMFRRECESLGLEDFPTAERLQWHGHQPETPDWSESSRFVAFTMVDSKRIELYVAFNTSHLPVIITLPERPGFRWEPYVDTSKVPPYDFLADDLPNRAIVVKQYDHFLNAGVS